MQHVQIYFTIKVFFQMQQTFPDFMWYLLYMPKYFLDARCLVVAKYIKNFSPFLLHFLQNQMGCKFNKLQVWRQRKKRTPLNKRKNHILLFSVEMLISLYIIRTFELHFYGCWWEVSLFLPCIKENNLSCREKKKVHMQISFPNKNILLKFTFVNKVNVV